MRENQRILRINALASCILRCIESEMFDHNLVEVSFSLNSLDRQNEDCVWDIWAAVWMEAISLSIKLGYPSKSYIFAHHLRIQLLALHFCLPHKQVSLVIWSGGRRAGKPVHLLAKQRQMRATRAYRCSSSRSLVMWTRDRTVSVILCRRITYPGMCQWVCMLVDSNRLFHSLHSNAILGTYNPSAHNLAGFCLVWAAGNICAFKMQTNAVANKCTPKLHVYIFAYGAVHGVPVHWQLWSNQMIVCLLFTRGLRARRVRWLWDY